MVFDSLGISYHYEPQGFDLGADVGPYLPDFWIPAQSGFRGGYVEIKPTEPTPIEQRKCEALAEGLAEDVYVFGSPIEIPDSYHNPNANPATVFLGVGGWDGDHHWCQCHLCGALGIEYGGWGARLDCGCSHARWCQGKRCTGTDSPDLRGAFAAAREERFDRAS